MSVVDPLRPQLSTTAPVILVGAGLAGLSAARVLHAAGTPVLVLDAASHIGGRVRTDRVDGFRLDRGFQVLLTSYPEARRLLDYDALRLGEFEPGALVRIDDRFHVIADPVRRPGQAFATLTAPIGTLADKLRLARLRRRLAGVDPESTLRRLGVSTAEHLRELGFSAQIVERFFRPFYGGVLLDSQLASTSRMFEFTFAHFARGTAAIPADGMGAIPAQLATGLPPDALRLGERVVEVGSHHVQTAAGARLAASAVVIATDGSDAAGLLGAGSIAAPRWRGTTVVYFDAPRSPLSARRIALRGHPDDGPAAHLCVPSDVAHGLAPAGRSLVSCTVLDGPGGLDEVVRTSIEGAVHDQCRDWFGPATDAWRHLSTVRVDRALPDVPSGDDELVRPVDVPLADGVVTVCGDHRDSASIQGAMRSGRRAAEAVLARLSVAAR